ncbi:hypothetical protein BDR07DRAFT_1387969 [Suillus spraguei]|nr:hypothetical protein BDR07DRAFT_1387969 [Suillus spraguei]
MDNTGKRAERDLSTHDHCSCVSTAYVLKPAIIVRCFQYTLLSNPHNNWESLHACPPLPVPTTYLAMLSNQPCMHHHLA